MKLHCTIKESDSRTFFYVSQTFMIQEYVLLNLNIFIVVQFEITLAWF